MKLERRRKRARERVRERESETGERERKRETTRERLQKMPRSETVPVFRKLKKTNERGEFTACTVPWLELVVAGNGNTTRKGKSGRDRHNYVKRECVGERKRMDSAKEREKGKRRSLEKICQSFSF